MVEVEGVAGGTMQHATGAVQRPLQAQVAALGRQQRHRVCTVPQVLLEVGFPPDAGVGQALQRVHVGQPPKLLRRLFQPFGDGPGVLQTTNE